MMEKKNGGQGPSILVIDDEAGLQQMLEMALEGEGYRVLLASNGVEGMVFLESETPPDLVLVDLMMPKMSGFEFLSRKSAATPKLAAIPTVVLTAAAPSLLRDPRLKLANGVVTKPFDVDQLLNIVAGLLGGPQREAG